MIRLNCGLIAETDENRKKAIALATELVELSLHDDGCIDYDLLESLTNTDRLVIYETWQDEASLKAHMASAASFPKSRRSPPSPWNSLTFNS